MSTSPLPPTVSNGPADFFPMPAPSNFTDSIFPLSAGLSTIAAPLPADPVPHSAPPPLAAPTSPALPLPARSSSRPPRPPRSTAATAAASAAAAAAVSFAPTTSELATALALPTLPMPTARKPALSRSTRGVKKPRKPRSPAAAAAAADGATASPAPATSPRPATCKTSLRKSNKPQPFLRLIDNLCNVFAAENAPVTAKTKKERNAAHAKKSDLKAQKYVEVLEKMAIAAANPASPDPAPDLLRKRPSVAAAAKAAAATSPGMQFNADTSPDMGEKEKDKLGACVSIKTQLKVGKSAAASADKLQQQEEKRQRATTGSTEQNDTSRDEDEVTASTDAVKSTVSDAMSTSSSVGTKSMPRCCRCPEVCKKDNAQEDVCLCEVPDSLRQIICQVFPFANKVEPQLSARPSATNGAVPAVPKCPKQIVKDTKGSEVHTTKPQASNDAPTNDQEQSNSAVLRSIPSLPRSDRSLSRMISFTPSSKEIDNIPSLSQMVTAGVSMALDTPPDYKNKYGLFAAAAGSGASLPNSNSGFIPEGLDNEFVGRTEVGASEDKEDSPKKQARSLRANPSPDTVQISPFVQQEGGGSSEMYLSPNRWDFGFTMPMTDQAMLSAGNDSGIAGSEEAQYFANFVSP